MSTTADRTPQVHKIVTLGKSPTISFNVLLVGPQHCGKSTFALNLFSPFDINRCIHISEEEYETPSSSNFCVKNEGSFFLEDHARDCYVNIYETHYNFLEIPGIAIIHKLKQYILAKHVEWINVNKCSLTGEGKSVEDKRIHCVFYFIQPNNFSRLDETFIEELSEVAVIVPVIAKADTMTTEEKSKFESHVFAVIRDLEQSKGLNNEDRRKLIYEFKIEENAMKDDDLLELKPPTSTLESNPINGDKAVGKKEKGRDQYLEMEDRDGIKCKISSDSSEEEELEYSQFSYNSAFYKAVSKSDDNDNVPLNKPLTKQNENQKIDISTEEIGVVKNIFAVICNSPSSNLRTFPWGQIYIYDRSSSDLLLLQELLLESGAILDMISKTSKITSRVISADSRAFKLPIVRGECPVTDFLYNPIVICTFVSLNLALSIALGAGNCMFADWY